MESILDPNLIKYPNNKKVNKDVRKLDNVPLEK